MAVIVGFGPRVVETVTHLAGRDFLQPVYGRHDEGHFGHKQGFSAEHCQELKTHGD